MSELAQALHAANPALTTPEDEDEIGLVTDKMFELLPRDIAPRVVRALGQLECTDRINHLLQMERIPREYKRLVITYGVALFPAEIGSLTRLCPANPPADVHSMVRTKFYAGDFYNPDMIVRVLTEAGIRIDAGKAYLDFGASSGRVVRVLYAAFPEARWYGCDPQERSIEWANENLPVDIDFFVSPLVPPLPGRFGAHFDGVYAVSIWSHFSERAAKAWFAEMHRCIKPGGWLFFTTHGQNTLHYLAKHKLKHEPHILQLQAELLRQGYAFADTFGGGGDWGIPAGDWGTAVMSPSWAALNLVGYGWSLKQFRVGRSAMNQDAYLLSREAWRKG